MNKNLFTIAGTGEIYGVVGKTPYKVGLDVFDAQAKQERSFKNWGEEEKYIKEIILPRYGIDWNTLPVVRQEEAVRYTDQPSAHPNYFFEKLQTAPSIAQLGIIAQTPTVGTLPPAPTGSQMREFTLPSGLKYTAPAFPPVPSTVKDLRQTLDNLDIITDPVTGKQYSKDVNVKGSTYKPYKPPTPSPVISTSTLVEPIDSLPDFQTYTEPPIPSYDIFTPPEVEMTAEEKEQSEIISRVRSLRSELIGESAYRREQQDLQDYPELLKTQKELTSKLNAIKAEAAAIPLQLEKEAAGKGITTTILGRQETARLRDNAIQALSVASLLEATNGNIVLANDLAERAVSAKFGPIKEEIAVLTANLELMSKDPALTVADKNRLQAQQDFQKKRELYVDLLKENAQEIYKISVTAASNGANFVPTPEYPSLTVALDDIPKSKTKEEALRKAIKAGLMQKKETKEIIKPEIEETKIDQVLRGEFGDIIKSASNLVGTERGKTSKIAMSEAIINNDYVSAYAQVANNVEESLTGEVKTKFANARTDYGIMQGFRIVIEDYANAGGDMGLLKGKEEDIKRKLGIDSGKASALAVALWREFQYYRSNMTGAAFTEKESRDYASVNPTLGKSLNLNLSVIDGALNQLENRITSTINTRIPNAKKLYDKVDKIRDDGLSDDDAYKKYLELKSNISLQKMSL